ncbi:MAG: 2-hydroxychromene-2-carboxylate isomerase [Pseudazoarcus pumilus]|nr:2-hydroxychromene-2-carboxylate isomerase [Pseudazoarcus pumilus]
MTVTIDYFYSPMSGYAYLGEPRLRQIADAAGARLRYRPMDVVRVFAATDTVPPFKQSEARLSYRREDLARKARQLGLPIHVAPRHWPADATLASRVIAAVALEGDDPGPASFALLSAVWADELDIAQPDHIAHALSRAGLDAQALLSAAQAPEAAAAVAGNTEAAIAARVFGSPTFVVNDERFWGQDRLEDLARHLHTLQAHA